MSNAERKGSSSFLYILAVIGALLVMNYTVKKVRHYTQPEPLGVARGEERIKARTEVEAAAQAAMTTYGWVDKDRQIVHLPVERGIELTLSEWQNPREGRAKLLALSAKATVELAVEPPPPSEFE